MEEKNKEMLNLSELEMSEVSGGNKIADGERFCPNCHEKMQFWSMGYTYYCDKCKIGFEPT